MFDPKQNSWNIRDTHFYLQYQRIRAHLAHTRPPYTTTAAATAITSENKNQQQPSYGPPVVIWAHNSHLVS